MPREVSAAGPKARYPGQFAFAMTRNPLPFLMLNAQRYGDFVPFTIGPRRCFLVSDPDATREVLVTQQRNFVKSRGLERMKLLLGDGLLTSEGEYHMRQRRLAQPAFHRERVMAYGSTMVAYAEQTSDRWRAGETFDVGTEMTRLTLGIVAKTLFGADVEGEAADIGAAITDCFNAFAVAVLPFAELLDHLPLPHNLRFRSAKRRLDATIYRIIAEHRAAGSDRGDLLSMLIAASDTDGDGAGMTDLQVRDEALTIFIAGHETTANVLTWTWYLLGEHPEIEGRLHEELDGVLGGRTPGTADLERLGYLRMVLAETMRLYPPAWLLGRRALADCTIGGHQVKTNDIIFMSQYVTHRDPRWYPEPDRFDPQRWTPEETARRPKFAYFPFGAGSRVCIGEQFALMEASLILATLAQRWQLRLVPGHPVVPRARITLRPQFGMRMTGAWRI
jgi:cytochrome P450